MAYTTIDDPSEYFQTVIWTGNDSNPRTISHGGNSDMQPDWLWHKLRSGILSHMMYDSTRGVGKRLHTDQNAAEATQSDTGTITAFTSNGFTVDAGTTNDLYVNDGSRTYVSWGWKANGGITTSQTGSDINSVTQVNADAKFSIVTYTGASSSDGANNGGAYWRVKHGLGSVPKVAIFKSRSGAHSWYIWHHGFSGASKSDGDHIVLNETGGMASAANILWGNTEWSTTEFEIGGWNVINGNGQSYIGYLFDEVQGYSKFGSYVGNGNANGTFVYTGFEPAWIMVKLSSADGNSWQIVDNKRNPLNTGNGKRIFPNNTNAESSSDSEGFDFLSNGFKLRNGSGGGNTNAATYIYMAFAESPFVSSEGVPTTAR